MSENTKAAKAVEKVDADYSLEACLLYTSDAADE